MSSPVFPLCRSRSSSTFEASHREGFVTEQCILTQPISLAHPFRSRRGASIFNSPSEGHPLLQAMTHSMRTITPLDRPAIASGCPACRPCKGHILEIVVTEEDQSIHPGKR